jgi:sulfofructose kinase
MTNHADARHSLSPLSSNATNRVDVAGVGLNATDTVIPLKHFPAPGSKVEFQTTTVLPGGQVATTMVACQMWGLQTRYVGKVGEDEAARLHRTEFARLGVEAQLVEVPGGVSPQSLILVDAAGERTVLCRRDDALCLQPTELRKEWVVQARALHLDGHDTAAATLAAGWAREAGIPVIADLDEIYPGIDDLLANIDYLIVSRDFPCRLMRTQNLEDARRGMQARYSSTLAAATLGQDGVIAWDGKQMHYAAAYHVPVIDTTGAGDIFHAGFIYALLQGWPLTRQLDFACAAAALNCRFVGARGGIAAVASIDELIRDGARYELPLSLQTQFD